MSQKIINKRSSVITEDGKPKLPSSDTIDYGEIAINYADGVETLSIKNSANEIIEFKSKEYVDNLVDNNKELYYIDFEYYKTGFNKDKLEELNNLAKRDDILIVTKVQNQLIIVTPSPYDENSSAYKAVSFRMIIGSDTRNPTTYGSEPKIRILTFTFIYEYGIGYYTLEFDKEIVLYTTGDGTQFLSDDGTYKVIATPTKVSELENDISMVTLNDSTTIKESVDGTELVPIFDGENKAVSVTELVKGAKELFVITPTLEGEFPTILTKDYLNNGMPVINAGVYYTKSFTRSFMDMGKNFREDYYIGSPALESGEKATVIIASYILTEPDRPVSFSIVPEINIIPLFYNGDGTQFLSDDGTYKPINVDTSAIEQRIDGVETTIEENELVTSTALNDLNARIIDIETNKASNTHDHDDKYLTSEQVQAMIDAAIAAAMGNNSTE